MRTPTRKIARLTSDARERLCVRSARVVQANKARLRRAERRAGKAAISA